VTCSARGRCLPVPAHFQRNRVLVAALAAALDLAAAAPDACVLVSVSVSLFPVEFLFARPTKIRPPEAVATSASAASAASAVAVSPSYQDTLCLCYSVDALVSGR